MSEFTPEQILANRRRIGDAPPAQEAIVKAGGAHVSRGYTTLTIKSAGDTSGKRRFTGIASTIATDLMDDVVVPRGMQAKLPVPCLWQHDHAAPIGWVTATRVSEQTIEADFEVATITEPGPLKDRIDTAWLSITAGLVGGLSIGFRPLESERIAGGGTRYVSWSLLEVSCVTIAANSDCSITQIRAADQAAQRTATPTQRPVPTAAKSDPMALLKSWRAATEAGDLESMVSLFNGGEMGEAIAMHAARAANTYVDGHWRAEIAKANGERKPVGYTADVHDAVFFLLKTALAKIDRLEVEVHQRAAIATERRKRQDLRYRGVFKHGEVYTPGHMTTFGGALWHCNSKTAEPPGGTPANPAWTLAVRRGADGKDLR